MVNGDGPNVGAVIASHPDVDMVSFTGSTRAGVLVAQAAGSNGQKSNLKNWAASHLTLFLMMRTLRVQSVAVL